MANDKKSIDSEFIYFRLISGISLIEGELTDYVASPNTKRSKSSKFVLNGAKQLLDLAKEYMTCLENNDCVVGTTYRENNDWVVSSAESYAALTNYKRKPKKGQLRNITYARETVKRLINKKNVSLESVVSALHVFSSARKSIEERAISR